MWVASIVKVCDYEWTHEEFNYLLMFFGICSPKSMISYTVTPFFQQCQTSSLQTYAEVIKYTLQQKSHYVSIQLVLMLSLFRHYIQSLCKLLLMENLRTTEHLLELSCLGKKPSKCSLLITLYCQQSCTGNYFPSHRFLREQKLSYIALE